MVKLTYNDKITIYKRIKSGERAGKIIKEYNVDRSIVYYLLRLVDRHGIDILKKENNNQYSIEFKKAAIKRVFENGESIRSVSIDIGLPGNTDLRRWIKKYKEMGYNIVERKRGRSPMFKKPKSKKNETKEEKKET